MIVLQDICRRFPVGGQTVKALDRVSMTVEAGDYLSIMGPSGSGKSTLLHILGLLDRPDAGVYRLGGRDVTSLEELELARERRERIGFVFQFFHLVPRLTALENVELPLTLAGVGAGPRRRRARQALVSCGLEERMSHRPDQLSGGQRQRVAIARATVTAPDLLLADEPTGNLDQRSGAEVVALLEGLNAEGITLILVTHDPTIGDRARRQVRMLDGRVVEDKRRAGAV